MLWSHQCPGAHDSSITRFLSLRKAPVDAVLEKRTQCTMQVVWATPALSRKDQLMPQKISSFQKIQTFLAAHISNSVPHHQCQRGLGMQELVMGFSKWRERRCVTTYRDFCLFSEVWVFTSSLPSKVKGDIKQNYVSHYCLNWFRQLLLLMVFLHLNIHE